jgi:hypothetical protein
MIPVCLTSPTTYLVAQGMDLSKEGFGFVLLLQNDNLNDLFLNPNYKGILSFPEIPLKMIKVRDGQYIGAGRTTVFSDDGSLQTYLLKMHETDVAAYLDR